MSNDPDDEQLLTLLMEARPAASTSADDAPDSPAATALLAGILSSDADAPSNARRRTRSRRARITAGALSAAAAITVAMVAVNSLGVDHGRVVVAQQPAAADVVAIARASANALSSGRADMTFDAHQGRAPGERGTAQIAFSGKNLDVALHFAAQSGQPGFDAHNRTVDGEYYLLDGVSGAKKWYHDTTAAPTSSDRFDLDPRALLEVLRPSAAFVVVDTATGPGGPVRHLRATHLGALPSLHLVLGPVDGRDITSLELWVGADDTVQRLALSARHREPRAPACIEQDGVKQCAKPGDRLVKIGRKVTFVPGPTSGATAEPAAPDVTTASFTMRFTDVGMPITISAPVGAVPIAGKG